MTGEAPLRFETDDEGAELARAELYGLLAALYFRAPDEALFEQFRVAVTQAAQPGAFLEAPWHELVAAMHASNPAAASEEFDALFLGIGRPEVFVYGSFYLAGFLNEAPLVALRDDLAELGLTRNPQYGETEDHVAYLFEVMRYLIGGDDVAVCNLERQRRFFRRHLQPWVESMFDAIEAHPRAQLYREVARFTRAFVQVETQAFDLLE
jgi:TorA maturation chaperone TorD